jgi:hypothetical protein
MRSLRARGGPAAGLTDADHLELWKTYNRRLLGELRRRPFPVIDFERPESLAAQVAAAIRQHGIEPRGETAFFEPEAVRHDGGGWRQEVGDRETLELWDELAAYAKGHELPG